MRTFVTGCGIPSMKKYQSALVLVALAVVATIRVADSAEPASKSWPQFRGPGGNAIAQGQSIPLPFGPERNLLWKTALPAGHSSPCVWEGQIFITGCEGTTLKMYCLDAASGKII
jgi:hypothetical protein